ncbi:MAG: P-loop NTPase [Candidatus Kapabacteria bacterium]|nr:P-loop NTPase [Candidatus Kapabacteria bacterium]MCS7170101.1 P-loop NTPase [Candidatus Kapabacteria bacterium]MDW7996200.1 P-loop NTPase [Bacteroidota bacterium]MDW8224491.1 P-loop NTPase [Bacteroidota bacterium]
MGCAGIPSHIITFCSGRAGIGKSTTLANLAIAAHDRGISCLLWDANPMAPSLHTLFGLTPIATASDSYLGNARIESIAIRLRPGLWLVPERAQNGESEPRLGASLHNLLRSLCEGLRPDLVLIDTAAGWSDSVAAACQIATTCCILMSDDIGSILDAYVLLKALFSDRNTGQSHRTGLVATKIVEESDAQSIAVKLNAATQRFLRQRFPLFGAIPYDPRHREALLQQRLFVEAFPHTPTSRAYHQLVHTLVTASPTVSYATTSHIQP